MINVEVSYVAEETETGPYICTVTGWAKGELPRDLVTLVRETTNIQSHIEIVAHRRVPTRREKLEAEVDARFAASVLEYPGLSDILGSDWAVSVNWQGGSREDYRAAAARMIDRIVGPRS